jgi:hypothetical protein
MPLELRRKCFLARLPLELTPQQLSCVGSWATENCALSRLYKEGDAVVLVAMREKPRSSKMHARLLRAALARLPAHVSLPTSAGKPWLRLVDEGEEFQELMHPRGRARGSGTAPARGEDEEGEERVVELAPRRASVVSGPPSREPAPAARQRLEVQKVGPPSQPQAPAGAACSPAEAYERRQALWALAERHAVRQSQLARRGNQN